jgi:hypothetical protein
LSSSYSSSKAKAGSEDEHEKEDEEEDEEDEDFALLFQKKHRGNESIGDQQWRYSYFGFLSDFRRSDFGFARRARWESPENAGFCAFSKVSNGTVKISEKTYCTRGWVCLYSGSRFPKGNGQHNLRDR